MLMMKTLPISHVDDGIKECIKNAKSLLDLAKKLNEDHFEKQSIIIFYLALEEFGKAVILIDKKKFAEHKEELEINTDEFFYDSNKKIKAAVRTIGPHIEIIKPKSHPMKPESSNLDLENNEFKMGSCNLLFIDYNSSDGKWIQKLSDFQIEDQKKPFIVLEKMLKKWDVIF